MPSESNRAKRLSRELSAALAADTVSVVMRIVRDEQSPESVASMQTAWLVQQVLLSLAEKEGKHDTLLRVPEAKFAIWASAVRQAMRRAGQSEKQ
jgi:hypothetical protein